MQVGVHMSRLAHTYPGSHTHVQNGIDMSKYNHTASLPVETSYLKLKLLFKIKDYTITTKLKLALNVVYLYCDIFLFKKFQLNSMWKHH